MDYSGLYSTLQSVIVDTGDQRTSVVDFRTFVTSPEYIGDENVYEYWASEFSRANERTSRCVLRGSLGAGKSTALNLLLLYKIYLLVTLHGDNIPVALGLMRGSSVFCLYFSVSLKMAERSGYKQLRNYVDGSKWFRENFPRDMNIQSEIRFPNDFTICYASGESHQIGINVWGFILDEANFRKKDGSGSVDDLEGVFRLAQQLENRLAQRFLRNGVENFFAGYISSASFETAFIQDIGDQYKNNENAIVLDPVLYKVDPSRYTPERFEIFFGFGELSPMVVRDAEHRSAIVSMLQEQGLVQETIDTLFEKVPLELKSQFEGKNSIYLSIQNICGRPTALRGSFITNYDLIKNAYKSDAISPFLQDFITVSNRDNLRIEDICDVKRIVSPQLPHSLFLDLSLQGDYGSMTCVRYDGEFGGIKYHTHVFTIEFIPPDFPAATDIAKIQNFIIWLSNYMNIACFGSDDFQSAQLRQEIVKALDLPNIRVSLDSTDKPHLLWLSACASHRFNMKKYERVDKEIREAVHDLKKRKVVKRAGSSDDGFQTLVGAFFLSDTIVAPEATVGPRLNVVGTSAAERLIRASNGGTSTIQASLSRLRGQSRVQRHQESVRRQILDRMKNSK